MEKERAKLLILRATDVGLLMLILTLPFSPRWGSLSMIFLGLFGVINVLYTKKWIPPPYFIFFLIGAYGSRMLWLPSSHDLSFGLKCLETELPLLAIPIIFSLFKVTESTKSFLLAAFVLMAFCVMIYSFIQLFFYIQQSPYAFFEYMDIHFVTAQYYAQLNMLTWDFAHYSFLSVIVVYGLHLLIYRNSNTRLFRSFILVYIITAITFFIFTGSKSGLALLIISFVVYGSIRFRNVLAKKISIALLFSISMIALAYMSQLNIKEYLQKLDSQRYQFFAVSIEKLKESPLFGFGTGATKEIIQDIDFAEEVGFSRAVYEGKDANHPHNQYLSELLQFGIIGSIPLFSFLISGFITSYKDQNWELLNVIISVSVFMLVESPINSNKGVLPFVILVSLLADKELKNNSNLHEQKMG